MAENSLFLTVQQGPNVGMVYPLPQSGVVVIGRHSDNSITIDHPTVSRRHAQLSIQNGLIALSDLGSANGTWVNGNRISSVVNIRPGDQISIGDEILLTLDNAPDSDRTIISSAAMMAKPMVAAAPVVANARQMPPPPPPSQGGSGKAWLIGAVLFLALIAIVLAAVIGFSLLNKKDTTTVESVAVAATNTPISPTATPYPTYTPYPTEAPTNTPYPTYTPYPTQAPTQTPYPTYTPFPTQAPTQTPYPTYTPFPTQKPPTATARIVRVTAANPTPTKIPTASTPDFLITLGSNVHYEPWGQPLDANGCSGPYNDYVQMKRFYLQVQLTNYSNTTIDSGWGPKYTSANRAELPRCVYRYDNLAVSPGETVDVTYVTYLQPNDYVTRASFWIFKDVFTICFNSSGTSIACPY